MTHRYKSIAAFCIFIIISIVFCGCQRSTATSNIMAATKTDNGTQITGEGETQNEDSSESQPFDEETKEEEWTEQALNGMGKYYYPGFELTYREIDGVQRRCVVDEEGTYIIYCGIQWNGSYYENLYKIGTKESETDIKLNFELSGLTGTTIEKCQLTDKGAEELILKGGAIGDGEETSFVYVFDTDRMCEITVGQDGDLQKELQEAVELQEGYSCGRVVSVYVEDDKLFAAISIDKINDNAINNDTEQYYTVQLKYNPETDRLELQGDGAYVTCEQYERLVIEDTEAFLDAWSTYAGYIEEKYTDVINDNDTEIAKYLQNISDCKDDYELAYAWKEYAQYLERVSLTQ